MWRFLWAVTIATVIFCYGAGCSPRNDASGSSHLQTSLEPESPLEVECERELLYLDSLIESRRRDRDFPPAVLAEVIELRQSAAELILDVEFELALELMDEAIALLREH
jgi:hypothetical protein